MTHQSSYLGKYSRKFIRTYNLISLMMISNKWGRLDFLNLGYLGNTLPFKPEKDIENNVNSISLYCKLMEDIPADTKSVLEIGSGLGGGCYLLKKYYHIDKVVGIDYTRLNVFYSNKKFNREGIKYYKYAAEEAYKLNQKFDVIISLEASQLFYDWKRFLESVDKLLNENGIFYYADIFSEKDIEVIERLIKEQGFKIEIKEDISNGVIESVKLLARKNEDSKQFRFIKKILGIDNLDKFDAYDDKAEMHQLILKKELKYIRYKIRRSQ